MCHLNQSHRSPGPINVSFIPQVWGLGKGEKPFAVLTWLSLVPGNKQVDDDTGLMDDTLQGGKCIKHLPGMIILKDSWI